MPYQQIAGVIARELGAPVQKIFKTFDPAPRAGASIGQVHNARLQDGTPVVVKIQRPGIEQRVNEDIAVMADIVRYASRHTGLGAEYDVEGWFDESALTLRNELDYSREGRNADTISRHLPVTTGFVSRAYTGSIPQNASLPWRRSPGLR